MSKKLSLYIFIFSIILLNFYIIFNCFKTKALQNNYFRLHIIANSNSIDDQITKLKVSKKINNYLEKILTNKESNKNETKQIVTNNIDYIIELANNELRENSKNYTSYANIGKIKYDEKKSDIINMEAGIYDSVQIILGDGNGENFWTLIFPYAYNSEFVTSENDIEENSTKLEIKSALLENIKKVAKIFS